MEKENKIYSDEEMRLIQQCKKNLSEISEEISGDIEKLRKNKGRIKE